MEELTISDIDILMKGVSAWEADTNGQMGDLFKAILIPKEQQESEEYKMREEEEKLKRTQDLAGRQEAAVLLKAKLIGLKNKLVAANLTS